jgi:hypothetical protein
MDWNIIISNRTPVKANDGRSCGYVVGEYKDNLLILDGRVITHEYMLPKDKVDRYDGSELYVRIPYDMISTYPF